MKHWLAAWVVGMGLVFAAPSVAQAQSCANEFRLGNDTPEVCGEVMREITTVDIAPTECSAREGALTTCSGAAVQACELDDAGNLVVATPTTTGPPPDRVVFRMFSVVICRVKNVLEGMAGSMWCEIKDALEEPLMALITLYIAIRAMMFVVGIIPQQGSQILKELLKIALVMAFATNGEYAIDIAYNFFVTLATEGISIVVSIDPDGSGEAGPKTMDIIWQNLDNIFAQTYGTDQPYMIGRQTVSLIGGAAAIASAVPVGGIIGGFMVTSVLYSLFVFIKAVLSYLLALAGIAFLTVLGPFFISMALFDATKGLFDRWLQSLISFALQPMLLFAFLMFMEQHIHTAFDEIACFVQERVIQTDSRPQCSGSVCTPLSLQQYLVRTDPCECEFIAPSADWSDMGSEGTTLLGQLIGIVAAPLLLMIMTNAFLAQLPGFAQSLAGSIAPRLGDASAGLRGVDQMFRSASADPSSMMTTDAEGKSSVNWQHISGTVQQGVMSDLTDLGMRRN